MKNEKFQKYFYIGLTAFVVLSLCTLLIFFLINGERVQGGIHLVCNILMPIIYGAVLAYLTAPIFNRTGRVVSRILEPWIKQERARGLLARSIATLISMLLLAAVVTALFSMLIPQLIESVKGIIEALPTSVNNLQLWIQKLAADNPELEMTVMQYYDQASVYLQNWLSNEVVPNITNIIGGVSSGLINIVIVMKNILIGLIVMVYLLNMKDKLVTQSKMIVYSAFPLRAANKIVEEFRYIHHVFGGFIIGKLLDSLIIGTMSFVLLRLMNMPYVLLISVIIGVTNVIPFFGPFIGAIPSAFLILLVSPLKCLYFIGFIILLQQFDGNILGPKILGDSTGLSSFWVLFSILLFGGLFGFVGMIIGVPTFAVFYRLVTELVTYFLGKRQLSANIENYKDLSHIDETRKEFVQNERTK